MVDVVTFKVCVGVRNVADPVDDNVARVARGFTVVEVSRCGGPLDVVTVIRERD